MSAIVNKGKGVFGSFIAPNVPRIVDIPSGYTLIKMRWRSSGIATAFLRSRDSVEEWHVEWVEELKSVRPTYRKAVNHRPQHFRTKERRTSEVEVLLEMLKDTHRHIEALYVEAGKGTLIKEARDAAMKRAEKIEASLMRLITPPVLRGPLSLETK